ncbi:hypothetical protein EGY05_17865 [Chryseobacterium arthrosphaerae]|uniref:hypothetical protein n=1 Tax=Chryseobacterium arthrosphaerae TaxID=651561 RepID=UPI000F4E10C7|nr:hypothetical protein [Chryseobacterium arthrosphaerae]AYZ13694.1 hypothetical protein EGY05_17865 [Chryseobacterium arthrosphaerae]
MKTKILLLFLIWSKFTFGQIMMEDKKIIIDANSDTKSFETFIEFFKNDNSKNEYEIYAINPNNYSISLNKDTAMLPVLQTDMTQLKSGKIGNKIGQITFKRNTELTITINATDGNKPVEKVYKIKTQTDWGWTTTFGVNAIFYTNRNKFASQKADDGTQKVAQVQSSKFMELMPALMFSFMDYQNTFSYGLTGGLGMNFEEIAIFTGVSCGIGHNFFLTGGVAVHKQSRPNTNYFTGQTIDSSITNDNLNESQYRVNPFIGISLRLDKNLLKK